MSNSWDDLISEISGIKPKAYLVLGSGWVREEWKSLCFAAGKGLTQKSVQNLSGFIQSLVPECAGRVLDQSARIDLMRYSFRDEHLRNALPTLFTHQYRPKFYDSLDGALQRGRMLFAHAGEANVLEARLTERLGFEPRREEFFLLNQFWEKLLSARDFFDEARLLEVACHKIRDSELNLGVSKLYRAEHFPNSPRVDFFWATIAETLEVSLIPSQKLRPSPGPYVLERKIAHSLEDTAQFLIDEILKSGNLDAHAVVIEDLPEVRRSISRIAKERGIAILDSRDPTFLATSEEMKTALLPLEIAARNFGNAWVLPWLNTMSDTMPGGQKESLGLKRRKIIELGNVAGLQNYKDLPEVYEALKKLREQYPTRMTVVALEKAILENVREAKLPNWVAQTFERIFNDWKISTEQLKVDLLENQNQKIPLRILLDELNKKIRSATPLQEPLRNGRGLKLYRVDQAPSLALTFLPEVHIHFFGLSTRFFEPSETGSEWFSVRDVDILSSEFGIPGRKAWADQARVSFCSWASLSTKNSIVWEYAYDEGGTEVESLSLLFQTLDWVSASVPIALPLHPKILPSLTAKVSVPIAFTPIELTRTEFPISFLNSLGNCAFTAYAQHLLKLYDERDPDFDLSGDSFGNLVHSAVEALVASKLQMTPLLAFQEAWKKTAKPAWIHSERLFKAIRGKTINILESFIESEIAYRERSHVETLSQEFPIQLKRSGFLFQGRLDRIDQHADGLVVIDYKTGSSMPSGSLTLEKGKGLQLPAYALALKDQETQEIIGAHYVQLLPKKTIRNTGLIFSKWNKGKKADPAEFPITTVTSRSSSLIEKAPDLVWKELDQKIEKLILEAKQGNFTARPADPKDCMRCRYQVLCGKLRDRSEGSGELGESIEVEI